MQQLEKRMLADIDRFSPEALMTSWLPLVPQGAEQMQAFFVAFFHRPQGHRKNSGDLPSAHLISSAHSSGER